jgi:hypothetical protein
MLGSEPLDTFARRVGIALTHGNHMHGCVSQHLVGWPAVLKPDLERVWFEPGKQPLADFGDQIPDGGLLGDGEFVNRGDMPSRGDDRVAIHNGRRVWNGNRDIVLDPDRSALGGAKRAGVQTGRIASCTLVNELT